MTVNSDVAGAPVQAGRALGPHYKWIALSNTTLGMLMATINQSIVLIALPDVFHGIGLDPLSPGNTSYLLWMFMGFLVVSAVLVVSFGRLGDMFGRVRMYTLGFAVFSVASIFLTVTWMHGARRGDVADHLAGRAGHRRRVPVRQLRRHRHRRVPGQPARHRPQRELDRGHRRVVHRPDPRRRARPDQLAPDLPRLGADRRVRHRLGVLHAARHRGAQARADGLVGQPAVRRRPDRHPGRHHLRPAALRRASDGLDQPVGAHRALRRPRAAGHLRVRRDQGRRAAVPYLAVQDPGVRRRERREPDAGDGPRRHAVHADHLAAGHLAAAARLQLQPDPAVGRHLPGAVDDRLPGVRAAVRHTVRQVRRQGVHRGRRAADGSEPSCC